MKLGKCLFSVGLVYLKVSALEKCVCEADASWSIQMSERLGEDDVEAFGLTGLSRDTYLRFFVMIQLSSFDQSIFEVRIPHFYKSVSSVRKMTILFITLYHRFSKPMLLFSFIQFILP